jgi:hypothetical protein
MTLARDRCHPAGPRTRFNTVTLTSTALARAAAIDAARAAGKTARGPLAGAARGDQGTTSALRGIRTTASHSRSCSTPTARRTMRQWWRVLESGPPPRSSSA